MEFDFKKIVCPVCEGEEHRFLGWRGGDAHQNGSGVKTAIVRCDTCSHQYPNPMPFPRGSLGEMYVDADEYFRGHDVEGKKAGGLGLMNEFEKRLGKKGHFLDVGCGAGELLWAADHSGWSAEGVDPSKEFIEIGRSRLKVSGRVGTVEEMRYPDESFDAIAMGGLIEHLYDPFGTLREIHRILRPSGWLWFDAPNEDGFYMSVGNLYMKALGRNWVVTLAPTFPPYHVQGFNKGSLTKLLDRTGFDVRHLSVQGEIRPQTGSVSVRKRIEYNSARLVNWLGKSVGKGMYMGVWAQKN